MNIIEILNTVRQNNNSIFLYTPQIYKNAISFILKKPKEIVICCDSKLVEEKLKLANSYIQQGLTGFAMFNYELGYTFENKLYDLIEEGNNKPLFTILFFDEKNIIKIASNKIDFDKAKLILKENKYSINNFKLNIKREKYIQDIECIKHYIKIGDTYQVNYTVNGGFSFNGSFESLFLSTIFNQSAQFSAFINLEDEIIISNSPELFLKIKNKSIIAKPMKGTIKRGNNIPNDIRNHSQLMHSEKDLAENVMIVDLLRNDIGRISKLNSVSVPSKFNVEKYETVYQLTSIIKGKLKDNSIYSLLKNTFPCGSITGTPKIRTMEIIKELENRERGLYTGSIGMFNNNNKAIFNVAIRTIIISKESRKGNIGIGSGIVWGSKPNKEYAETKLKAKYLTNPDPYFEIIETLLFENGNYFLLDEHMKRLKQASEYFLFVFDRKYILRNLTQLKNELLGSLNESFKVKLLLDKWGSVELTSEELTQNMSNIKVKISSSRINSKNKFQYFKTTNREFYDKELQLAKEEGFDEVIFLNEKDYIAEGSISNIFIKKNQKHFTPKISSGILNGVCRDHLISNSKSIYEKNLKLIDIIEADEIYLVNSVRKKIKVKEVWKGNIEKYRMK